MIDPVPPGKRITVYIIAPHKYHSTPLDAAEDANDETNEFLSLIEDQSDIIDIRVQTVVEPQPGSGARYSNIVTVILFEKSAED